MGEGKCVGASTPSDWKPLDHLDSLQESWTVAFMEPRRGGAKREGVLIDLGRRITDYAEGCQEEALSVIRPFTGHTRLHKKCEYGPQQVLNPRLTDVYHL